MSQLSHFSKSVELVYSFENDTVEFPISSRELPVGFRKLMIPVEEFRGESEGMEQDFYVLVKSDQHPLIIIEFRDIHNLYAEPEYIIAEVGITMAGVSSSYMVPVEVRVNEGGNICLEGYKAINISDFQLDPPVKFFGLIEVEDHIGIDFSVNFKADRQTGFLLSK